MDNEIKEGWIRVPFRSILGISGRDIQKTSGEFSLVARVRTSSINTFSE
jgi:hypothetical protein